MKLASSTSTVTTNTVLNFFFRFHFSSYLYYTEPMRSPSNFGRGGRGGRGGGFRGGRGGRGGRGFRDEGPPDFVVEVGQMMHECESEMVCKLTEKENKIPYFNAPIHLENKKKIGKVDEVSDFYFCSTVQCQAECCILLVCSLSYLHFYFVFLKIQALFYFGTIFWPM